MKKRIVSLFLVCFCMLSLVSCKEHPPAEEVLSELLAVSALPRGIIYRSGAQAGEAGYADEALLSVLYGTQAVKCEFPLVESYAIYSSGRMELCEVAVFCLFAESDTRSIAEMCHARAHIMERYLATSGEHISVCVFTKGRWVVMAVCENAERIVERAGRLVS